MKYINLSLEELRELSVEAAQQIQKQVDVDLIIYIAHAGLPIATYMNEVFNCQVLGIEAKRKGNTLKAIVLPIVSFFPEKIKNLLRLIELKSGFHKRNPERAVSFCAELNDLDIREGRKILVVDDSVDTGYSMLQSIDKIRMTFPNAEIYSYALNVWDESKKNVKIDFFNYENTIMRTPMSKDQREYRKHSYSEQI